MTPFEEESFLGSWVKSKNRFKRKIKSSNQDELA